jgi:hypothetical protein
VFSEEESAVFAFTRFDLLKMSYHYGYGSFWFLAELVHMSSREA